MAARWLASSFTLSLMVVGAVTLAFVRAETRAQTVPTMGFPDALRAHVRSERFAPLPTVAALPASLREALSELFNTPTLEMADPGKPFQATDVMMTPRLPARRLVAAGCSADHCLVYYERGGIVHVHQIVLFSKTDPVARYVYGGGAARGLTDLEQVKDALLSGKLVGGKYW